MNRIVRCNKIEQETKNDAIKITFSLYRGDPDVIKRWIKYNIDSNRTIMKFLRQYNPGKLPKKRGFLSRTFSEAKEINRTIITRDRHMIEQDECTFLRRNPRPNYLINLCSTLGSDLRVSRICLVIFHR